jgi:ankyrin repeat protein
MNSENSPNDGGSAPAHEPGALDVKSVELKSPPLDKSVPVNQLASVASMATSVMVRGVVEGKIDAVRQFLRNKAAVNAVLEDQWTVLLAAAWHNRLEILKLLVQAGADLNARTSHGWTALMMASFHGSARMVKYLLDQKVDVNQRDINGKTALMWAAQKGSLEIVQMLLAQGAALNARNNRNMTACDYAIREKRAAVLAFLQSQGAEASQAMPEQIPSGKSTSDIDIIPAPILTPSVKAAHQPVAEKQGFFARIIGKMRGK